MKNIHLALLLFFVAVSSAASRELAANPELSGAPKSAVFPGDGETERSPNALLRGALSAEGVYVESDSYYAAGGEEGRFETGAPEFLEEEASCKADGEDCDEDGECCNGDCKCFMLVEGGVCSNSLGDRLQYCYSVGSCKALNTQCKNSSQCCSKYCKGSRPDWKFCAR